MKEKLQAMKHKGQSLVDNAIGIMVSAIVIGAVAIPVVQDVISTTNFTNSTVSLIMSFVTVGLAVSLFIAAFSIVR